jgi:protocatechuate 3,4-dioxygenase, beta subunit
MHVLGWEGYGSITILPANGHQFFTFQCYGCGHSLLSAMDTNINPFHIPLNRRRFMDAIFKASTGFLLPGFLAEALAATPTLTQGPYYPLADDIPLDKDNDLIRLNDNLTLATGVITWVTGTVYDVNGSPVGNALVELWAADHEGDYLYSSGAGRNPACDANFAGFGQFLTGSSGRFRFRTIKAGLYPGRTRHFHWGITLPGRTSRVCTQTGWNEVAHANNGSLWATQNSNDNVFAGIPAAQRADLLLNFAPVPGTTTGEVEATWNYSSEFTPLEHTYQANGGQFVLDKVETVAGPSGTWRTKLTISAITGYTYELYTGITLDELASRQIPFSLTPTGAVGNHKYTSTATETISFYVPIDATDSRRFYSVSYRIPGANAGTP